MSIQGKTPPQALDVEQTVLGILMLEPERLDTAYDRLHPELFYSLKNQKIFSAIQILYQNQSTIDIITITEKLRSSEDLKDIGGAFYITELADRISSGQNLETYIAILEEKCVKREAIRIGNEMIRDAYDDTDAFDLTEKFEKSISNISLFGKKDNASRVSDLVIEEMKCINQRGENKGQLLGIPSGFLALDRLTNGWQNADLIVCASRPGMGKTAIALCAARNAAMDCNIPVAFFSLEMSKEQLTQRLLSSESEIPLAKIRSGNITLDKGVLRDAAGRLSNAPLFIDDSSSLTLYELRSRARKLRRKHGIGLIIVDYLQLMSGTREKNSNREQEISSISRGLKALSKELSVAVIAISQLSRSVESRADKTPLLSDLRESGAIEQDADLVMFLYRPAYYKEQRDGVSVDEKAMDVIIAKHRNGPLGVVGLMFEGHLTKVKDWIEQTF